MNLTQRAASLLALTGYYLSRYKLLFIRLDELALGLLLLTPAYFLGWQSWRTGLPLRNMLLSLACLLLLPAFWSVRRQRYTLFEAASVNEGEIEPLKAEEKIRLRGTGYFEVSGMRRYLFAAPAAFWKTELEDYILMAQVNVVEIPLLLAPTEERGMWYVFISAIELTEVTPGALFFGLSSLPTLRVVYQAPGRTRASVYLSFERADDLCRILTEISRHSGSPKNAPANR